MPLDKRETELSPMEKIIKMCREVRRDIYRKRLNNGASCLL